MANTEAVTVAIPFRRARDHVMSKAAKRIGTAHGSSLSLKAIWFSGEWIPPRNRYIERYYDGRSAAKKSGRKVDQPQIRRLVPRPAAMVAADERPRRYWNRLRSRTRNGKSTMGMYFSKTPR